MNHTHEHTMEKDIPKDTHDCCEKGNTGASHHGGKNNHEHHGHGSHGGHAMGHGSAQEFLRRFWIVTFLLIPLVLMNESVAGLLGIGTIPFAGWLQFIIATVIFGFSLVFFKHASHEIKARRYGMMTLVSLAVASGYLFSVVSTFLPSLDTQFYLEISTLIWVLLFGHYLEARSGAAAGNALKEVAALLPQVAHRIAGVVEEDVPVSELLEGDIILVKTGERIPADGTIQIGGAHVNESLISGESAPVAKAVGDAVIAGSICLDGTLTIVLTRVGEHSTVGQIQKLIADAQMTKPRTQRIADKASAVLTFVAAGTALGTLVGWTFFSAQPFVFAMTLAITVLVIACPHALGLAIPTVTTISTALAVKNGVFVKNLAKLETVRKATHVIFDKTGTLTEGSFGVTDIMPLGGSDEKTVLSIAASLDKNSSHIIAQTVVSEARERGVGLNEASNFSYVAGRGSMGSIDGVSYAVGSAPFMKERGVLSDEASSAHAVFASSGKTTVFVADAEKVLGIIALSDTIREESYRAIRALHDLGVSVVMLTGDTQAVARAVAEEIGVDDFVAEVLPKDKYARVSELQDKGAVVLMVGDGINDAPALTQADVGVAIGAGTDVAVEAGDVVLTRNNPEDVARLIRLARVVYKKMIQNLVWALGYNIVAIPAAAGLFAHWGFFLRPEVGALVMSTSTVIVVLNALTLRKVNLG